MENQYEISKACKIQIPEVYGYLTHEPTKTKIAVYNPIGKFKRFMINWCFGLKYEKDK